MNVRQIILKILEKKDHVRTADIVKITGFSRSYINRFFQDLEDEGKIILIGKANKAKYILATEKSVKKAKKEIVDIHLFLNNKELNEDQVLGKIKKTTGIFINASDNVLSILSYAFTEMLNNAIEHSKSEKIEVKVHKDRDNIRFEIIDRGIGIFQNIINKKKLKDVPEAIQDLLKGKLTTDPEAHSGEGIFFTSKVGDTFIIQSASKKLIFNNLLEDVFIKDIKNRVGTQVGFSIGVESKREISEVFEKFTDDSFEFSKTKVIVKLSRMSSEQISRSQARRILSGLEKFKTIILDFKDVDSVGQAFADEVFRVWKANHTDIKIIYENANENVLFMIKRAITNSIPLS